MIVDEKKILEAYRQCGLEEVKLKKLERELEAMQAKTLIQRRLYVDAKDKLFHLHHNVAPIVEETVTIMKKQHA